MTYPEGLSFSDETHEVRCESALGRLNDEFPKLQDWQITYTKANPYYDRQTQTELTREKPKKTYIVITTTFSTSPPTLVHAHFIDKTNAKLYSADLSHGIPNVQPNKHVFQHIGTKLAKTYC